MEEHYQLIPEIVSNNQKWRAKVIVVEKQSSKPSKQGNGRYQHLVLMDTQGNIIQASLYDSNISAFEDQLILGKTYAISEAYVKNITTNYRYSIGSHHWTISGETRLLELNEDNLEFIFSMYQLTLFHELEQYMDTDADLNIIAIAIDMTPKRMIQSKDGNQTWVQDVTLLDKNFETMVLTLWDSFVDRECVLIAESIEKKLVIFATHLRVTSFFGLELSTKVRSTFFINTPFTEIKEMAEWVKENSLKIDDLVLKKSYTNRSPTNLSPPVRSKFTPIQNIRGRLLAHKFYWVNATATADKIDNKSWYMACNNCFRRSNVDFGETYLCIFCKNPNSKAIPRARAYVQLSDVTGSLNASAIGEPTEKLLFTSAETLMKQTNSDSQTNFEPVIQKMRIIERAFYLKAFQIEPNSSNYRFDIIFVADLDSGSPNKKIQTTGDTQNLDTTNDTIIHTNSPDSQENWSPPAKRALFKSKDHASNSEIASCENINSDISDANPFAPKQKMK